MYVAVILIELLSTLRVKEDRRNYLHDLYNVLLFK